MGRRGPPPKPTKLRLIQGNPGKQRINHSEPKPEPAGLDCPALLKGEARKKWSEIAPKLLRYGLFTELDRDALAAYCQAYSEWARAVRMMAKDGVVRNYGQKGYEQISAWVTVADKSLKKMKEFLTQFGMTPSSRSALSVDSDPAKSIEEILVD